jgi:DNA-directed RNA polymerase specialized sigma24 family protein
VVSTCSWAIFGALHVSTPKNTIAQMTQKRTLPDLEIEDFFEILRSGEPQAVVGLLNWLDPWLRVVIRSRIAARRRAGSIEVSDVLQSLLEDFVRGAKRDRREPERRGDIERYLAGAVAKKLLTRMRKERGLPGTLTDWPEPEALEESAYRIAEGNDFVASIGCRLDDKNKKLMELRLQGYTWLEVSEMIGGNPDALRIGLRRSVAAATCEMNRRDIANGG